MVRATKMATCLYTRLERLSSLINKQVTKTAGQEKLVTNQNISVQHYASMYFVLKCPDTQTDGHPILDTRISLYPYVCLSSSVHHDAHITPPGL